MTDRMAELNSRLKWVRAIMPTSTAAVLSEAAYAEHVGLWYYHTPDELRDTERCLRVLHCPECMKPGARGSVRARRYIMTDGEDPLRNFKLMLTGQCDACGKVEHFPLEHDYGDFVVWKDFTAPKVVDTQIIARSMQELPVNTELVQEVFNLYVGSIEEFGRFDFERPEAVNAVVPLELVWQAEAEIARRTQEAFARREREIADMCVKKGWPQQWANEWRKALVHELSKDMYAPPYDTSLSGLSLAQIEQAMERYVEQKKQEQLEEAFKAEAQKHADKVSKYARMEQMMSGIFGSKR